MPAASTSLSNVRHFRIKISTFVLALQLSSIPARFIFCLPFLTMTSTAKASLSLPEEGPEGDIDLGSDELKEVLADAPIVKKAKVATVAVDGDGPSEEERGKGTFELGEWV